MHDAFLCSTVDSDILSGDGCRGRAGVVEQSDRVDRRTRRHAVHTTTTTTSTTTAHGWRTKEAQLERS